MAAKEMYDYLTTISPDYSGTLNITPQKTLVEGMEIPQVVHEYDSGEIDVITLSTKKKFTVSLQWSSLSETDSGTILDFYNDASKANGKARTFYWTHIDGHTYVVRFMSTLSREYTSNIFASNRTSIKEITLRVEGRKVD